MAVQSMCVKMKMINERAAGARYGVSCRVRVRMEGEAACQDGWMLTSGMAVILLLLRNTPDGRLPWKAPALMSLI